MNLSERIRINIPEIGLIAGTRALAGAGAALLLTKKWPEEKRRMIGWTFFAIGAITTIPILAQLISETQKQSQKTQLNPGEDLSRDLQGDYLPV